MANVVEGIRDVNRRVLMDKEWSEARKEMEPRPTERSQCIDGPRPCPFLTCRYNLSLTVTKHGAITMHSVDRDGNLEEGVNNCALDRADAGIAERKEVGSAMGVQQQQIWSIEKAALEKVDNWRSVYKIDPRLPHCEVVRKIRVRRDARFKTGKTTQTARDLIRAARKDNTPPADHLRPAQRKDCENTARPCPFVGCRHNLSLDVTRTGSIQYFGINHEGEFDEGTKSNCALDYAENGGMKLEEIAIQLKMTRERVRQQQDNALANVRKLRILNDMDKVASGDA